jgi:hypothetical protein
VARSLDCASVLAKARMEAALGMTMEFIRALQRKHGGCARDDIEE